MKAQSLTGVLIIMLNWLKFEYEGALKFNQVQNSELEYMKMEETNKVD